MRILAIDTSNPVLSLAVTEDGQVLGEVTANLVKNHSTQLMDRMSELMDALGVEPESLDGIVVAHGPGSYTGVRIGVATAKSMAWALGIPAAGVSSLEVIAANGLGFPGLLVPLFDARRGRVYTGCYRAKGMEGLEMVLAEQVIPLQDWLALVKEAANGSPVLFLGEDVRLHRQKIEEEMGDQASFAPPSFQLPRASLVAWLGQKRLESCPDAHQLVPEYLQLSEAEAKWANGQNAQGK